MRLRFKIIFLAAAVLLAVQAIPGLMEHGFNRKSPANYGTSGVVGMTVTGRTLSLILPALSPLSAIASAVSRRSLGWVFLLGIPLLVMGLLKGRWFCFRLCPTGFISALAGKMRPESKSKFIAIPQLGSVFVFLALGGAVVGYPLFLWLDPLCMFNGFFSVWHSPVTLLALLPAFGFVLVIGLSVWRPNAWCYRLCPLGFLQELLGKVWRYVRFSRKSARLVTDAGYKPDSGMGRRLFMALAIGVMAGFVFRRYLHKRQPIRPPGAVDESQFTALCSRCGNCIRACPGRIIVPDTGQAGAAGFLAPILVMDPGYCLESCNECTKVCPTGALGRMSQADKNKIAIGTAVVDKRLCLAWENGHVCMVCDEYCPYHAIRKININEVPCPEIDPEACRGCGACQVGCPLKKKAVVVHGKPQRKLAQGGAAAKLEHI